MSLSKQDPNYIKWLLINSDEAVKRAVVTIYRLQTLDEKEQQMNRHCNQQGFTVGDVRRGSQYACRLIGGKGLEGSDLDNARNMMLKYINQLSGKLLN